MYHNLKDVCSNIKTVFLSATNMEIKALVHQTPHTSLRSSRFSTFGRRKKSKFRPILWMSSELSAGVGVGELHSSDWAGLRVLKTPSIVGPLARPPLKLAHAYVAAVWIGHEFQGILHVEMSWERCKRALFEPLFIDTS